LFRYLEAISTIGFWFKIPFSPRGCAGTYEAGPGFPAEQDFRSDPIIFVGRDLQVRLRRIEDLKRGTHKKIYPPLEDLSASGGFMRLWRIGTGGIFETAFTYLLDL